MKKVLPIIGVIVFLFTVCLLSYYINKEVHMYFNKFNAPRVDTVYIILPKHELTIDSINSRPMYQDPTGKLIWVSEPVDKEPELELDK